MNMFASAKVRIFSQYAIKYVKKKCGYLPVCVFFYNFAE